MNMQIAHVDTQQHNVGHAPDKREQRRGDSIRMEYLFDNGCIATKKQTI